MCAGVRMRVSVCLPSFQLLKKSILTKLGANIVPLELIYVTRGTLDLVG